MNPGHSTWPSRFGSSRHTSGLIGDVRQAGQAAGKLGQPSVGEQLVDGGGFSHPSCGDHRHRPEQSAAAGAHRAQHLTLGLAANSLRVEEKKTGKKCQVSFIHSFMHNSAQQQTEGDHFQLPSINFCNSIWTFFWFYMLN